MSGHFLKKLKIALRLAPSFLLACNAVTESNLQKTSLDAGAWINQQDIACGTINVVNAFTSATVNTAVTLSLCHNLYLQTPLTWNTTITLDGNNRVYGIGASAPQTLNLTSSWINAAQVANLQVDTLWVNWPTVTNSNYLFSGKAVSNLKVLHTHSIGGGYARTDSSANSYSGVVLGGNTSETLYAEDNFVDGVNGPCIVASESPGCAAHGPGVYAAWYAYSEHITDKTTTCVNTSNCRSVWGGNNTPANSTSSPGDWTSMSPTTLKANDVNFSGLVATKPASSSR